MIFKRLIMCLAGTAMTLSAAAQNASADTQVLGQTDDGKSVTLLVTGVGKNKKAAEEDALKSAYAVLFYTGVPGLKEGAPMFANEDANYSRRFFSDGRYVNFLAGEPRTTQTGKIGGNNTAGVVMTIKVDRLVRELARNNVALHANWAEKGTDAKTTFDPVIVIVPYTDAARGYSFDDMRRIFEASPFQRQAITSVARHFSEQGYKTRDFISMLQSSNNKEFLSAGTQTNDASLYVQQLPGDIKVQVEAGFQVDGKGNGEVTLRLRCIENQTQLNLANREFPSGSYYSTDSLMLISHAIKKVSGDFFSQLEKSFNDMVASGREVFVDFSLSDTVDDFDFESDAPATGEYFKDALDEWLRANAFLDKYNMDNSTDKYIRARVYIPLWDKEKNRSYTISNFRSELRKFLKQHLGDAYKPVITAAGSGLTVVIE